MSYSIKPDKNRLYVYHEGRKRRVFVGELIHEVEKDRYAFIYDAPYVRSKTAIPISPELSLFKLKHYSKKGELFPVFIDRIPDKGNPAYKTYCEVQGISPLEKNPIILLGTIGRRGPSSFVFELIYEDEFKVKDIIKARELCQVTQHDFAQAFDISKATLQRIEAGESHDQNTIKRIKIMFKFPDVAIWQLAQTGRRVHASVLGRLLNYFMARDKFKL